LMGGLLGIMREEALLYAESLGTTVQRCSMNKGELEAGQLLLANCLLGVVPVGSVRYPVVGRLVDHFRMDI
ncbi:MAG TPA: 4-amino-4-deoxychorismate lyase, partial [Myxococcota bacterium]|nr:4-amino-4-deoxychorismate lyase [Myxococcota bacterium]